jgi:hypothetical protein
MTTYPCFTKISCKVSGKICILNKTYTPQCPPEYPKFLPVRNKAANEDDTVPPTVAVLSVASTELVHSVPFPTNFPAVTPDTYIMNY